MTRRVAFTSFLALCLWQSTAVAQVADATAIDVGPDTGDITGSPASPGRVKCWVSRSSTGAVAISVFEDGTTLSAKFRRYSKEEEEYSQIKTKIQTPPTTPGGTPTTIQELSTVPVRLVAVTGVTDTYTMIYDSLTPEVQLPVGFVKFVRGNNQRASSDVVVRFKNIEGAIDPCNQPPIDDIGEEEEVPVGLSANAPGPSLPFTAPVSP